MNRISRWHSRMCSRPSWALSTVSARLALGVLVARPAPDPLVAAGAERPLAVLVARAVAGQQHAADVAGGARVLEHPQQLVDGVRPERVEHVGPVERDPDRAVRPGPVVGQVGEVLEAGDVVPRLGVEDLATLRRWRSWRYCASCSADGTRPWPLGPINRGSPPVTGSTRPTTWSAALSAERSDPTPAALAEPTVVPARSLGGAAGARQCRSVGRVLRPDPGAARPAGRAISTRATRSRCSAVVTGLGRAGLGDLQPAGRARFSDRTTLRRGPTAAVGGRRRVGGRVAARAVGRAERRR